jgi:uncharacterized protein (TIGR02284 family)
MNKSRDNIMMDRLLRRCRESEHGFLVAAENVSNQGLKAILKTYAQQRREFALEIEKAAGEERANRGARQSWLSSVHRGWIGLRATMTLGEMNTEHVVLSEALRGESLTLNTYQQALDSQLPLALRPILERQHAQIQADHEHLALLRGNSERQLIIGLFDRDEYVSEATAALERAGFNRESIEQLSVSNMFRPYQRTAERSTKAEQVLATTLLGAAFLGPLGLVVGFSLHTLPAAANALGMSLWLTVLMTTFIGIMTGGGMGAFFGLLLGQGIQEQDSHLYQDGLRSGNVMVRVHAESGRAREAAYILQRVNASARSRRMRA